MESHGRKFDCDQMLPIAAGCYRTPQPPPECDSDANGMIEGFAITPKICYTTAMKNTAAIFTALTVAATCCGQFASPRADKPLEEPLAFKDAMALAQKGEARGFYQLAICFSAGNGVERNRATGYRYLKKAAEMGYGNALYVMGRIMQSHLTHPSSFLDLTTSLCAIRTYDLAEAMLWDGETYRKPITDDDLFLAMSNCYAKAVAAGADMAKYDLAGILDLRDYAMKERAAADSERGKRTENAKAAKAAFPDLFAEEYPLSTPESSTDTGYLKACRRPNEYLDDVAASYKRNRKRERDPAAMLSRRKQMEQEQEKKAEKQYDNLRIDSICGIEFGKKPPEWYKPTKKGWRDAKLPRPFRYLTRVYLNLTKDGLVKEVLLQGNLQADAGWEEMEEERQNVMAILEKKYNFEFPRSAGKRTDYWRKGNGSYGNHNFGRYRIHVNTSTIDGLPHIDLTIADAELAKQEAMSQNLPKSIPAGVGADAL